MKKTIIIIAILLVITAGALFVLDSKLLEKNITGKVIEEDNFYYSYTKAICDENNLCQDYEIQCKGKEVIEKKAITGAVVQHSNDWEDSRSEEMIKGICNVSG